MKQDYSSQVSETEWDRVESMADDEIDLDETPELTVDQFRTAGLRVDGKPIERGKLRVNIFLDNDLV